MKKQNIFGSLLVACLVASCSSGQLRRNYSVGTGETGRETSYYHYNSVEPHYG